MSSCGIDRKGMVREISELGDECLLTLTRQEARDLIDKMPEDTQAANDLMVCLDQAQGEDREARRYVVVYVLP